MGPTIFRLSDVVINQIAAGEVVEHPASAIKELIENSIDAKARTIAISIWGGGFSEIVIEDDGIGMSREDALLAFERHATSKIQEVEDLSSLTTMGFRGEALAAIASISHFELKTFDGAQGTLLSGKGGVIEQVSVCARNRGTTLRIGSLFFNVPARKKFQKSVSATSAQVRKTIEILGLANPEIAFTYCSNGEKVFSLPRQERKERIEAILGPFAHEIKKNTLWGVFGSPQDAKSHRKGQFLFINGRPLFSPLISKAVQMGYATRLAEHTYPPFVLFLEIDPQEIDVNVHPQKKEVRLAKEADVFSLVETAVRSLFEQSMGPCFSGPLSFEEPLPFLLAEERFSLEQQFMQMPLQLDCLEKPLAVLGSYLLLEANGLWCVDLESALSRILFEQFEQGTPHLQVLLEPLQLSGDQETVDSLTKLGIDCRLIGVNTMAIDAIPSTMSASSFETFVIALQEDRSANRAAILACRHGKKIFTLEEAFHLWQQLKKCRDSLYDPLGKKIWVPMDLKVWFSQQE